MYWKVTLGWAIIGTIIFWISLSLKWNRTDYFNRSMFRTLQLFNSTPGSEKYLDLKFSVLRHSFVFLLSAALIAWIDSRFITSIITYANLLYCLLTIARYRFRKKEVRNAINRGEQELANFMAVPVKDSFVTVIHAVTSVVILYILPVLK